LPNKLTELRILAAKNDYDVFCVAEIKPKNTNNPLDDAHIGFAGYFLFTNLQDDPRRGIAVYVKANLSVSRISLNKVLDWVEYLARDNFFFYCSSNSKT